MMQKQEQEFLPVSAFLPFVALIPLVFIIPRLTDSLHPGNGGNPALGGEDLDHTLRLFLSLNPGPNTSGLLDGPVEIQNAKLAIKAGDLHNPNPLKLKIVPCRYTVFISYN